MKSSTYRLAPMVVVLSLVSSVAHGGYHGRDLDGDPSTIEAIYDSFLDITWLRDADYAVTSGYHASGMMSWHEATTWAANLSFYNPVKNITYDDWRLPATMQPDPSCSNQTSGVSGGFGCMGSELGHLFYFGLSGTAGHTISQSGDPDFYAFTHLYNEPYWSGTEAPDSSRAWYFNTYSGFQATSLKTGGPGFAWAVTSGDVAAVPEADTWVMLLAGAGLVGWAARRKAGSKRPHVVFADA